MAFRVNGLRVESRNLTVFAQGTVGDITVTNNPADCGVPPNPGCCGATYDTSLIIAAQGPLELFYSQVTLDWTLDWDGERQSWAGSVTDGSVEIRSELWCEEDPELGTLWWISGSYVNGNGDSIPYFVVGTLYDEVLVFEVEISGASDPLTIVVAHPCTGAGGSTGGGTGPVTLCGCSGLPLTVYVEFTGALSAYGVQALTWSAFTSEYLVTPSPNACNSLTTAISLACSSGSTYQLSMPFNVGGTTFSVTATATTCTPLLIDFSGTATGACSGAFTAQVRETP